MAQFSFTQLVEAEGQNNNNQPNTNGNNNYNNVTFFSLKNDGEKAFVRFILDDPDKDLECLSTHEVYIGGKARKVNCLRESINDPLEKCPLCQLTSGIKNRAYLRMIQYVNDGNGNYNALPKVWERSVSFITKQIVPFFEFYPNSISSAVFQITRQGKAGSTDTTYNIMALPNMTPEKQAKLPLNKDLFKNYKALGTIVIDKNYDDMVKAIKDGEYQVRTQAGGTATATSADVATPKATVTPVSTPAPTPAPQAPASQPAPSTFTNTASAVDYDLPF